ncbi:flagellar hook-associated protein FlgK [Rhizobium paknamense]|uniref:Flagellar hook-associated protein 1 n=1 Tax=Rhizobium paknamense TaxID=1206817 RepID=A0ABU0IFI3_9HYPH|nr:flagellar hook-associated protein FlgK [Rhizobium paknamense]MDQ0457004.1 flagellar hook-associated protein 1 FlgK [Rhizobium paknamense]
MSLSSTLNTAKNALSNTSMQSQVLSKNIANSQTEGYVRRDASTVTSSTGATILSTSRSTDSVMQKQMLSAQSQAEGQDTLNTGLTNLKALLGGNDYELAPSTYLTKLRDSLQSYATKPGELSLGQTAVSNAQDLANSLNTTSEGVQAVRAQADANIKTDVAKLNDLLSQFKTVNDAVVQATVTGANANDALDQRDKLLSDISKIVGISTTTRDNNDMAVYTSDGTVLFETQPRSVTFTATSGYGATSTGNPVYIDGVPLKAGSGGNTSAQGSLQANLQIRDVVAPKMQDQLDETARSLISMFSETTDSSGSDPAPGLFVWSDTVTPDDGVLQPGIAETISVNTAYVTSEGGTPTLLRDGGYNGSSYKWNTNDDSGYSTLLQSYVDKFDDKMNYDSAADLGDSSTVLDYASASNGWLEAYRSTSDSANENKAALSQRATEAYQNKTGVNLDEELSRLLDIEQSYKASTKLITAVDDMLKSLMDAV